MIQGTGSDAGKTTLVAGLAPRWCGGARVAPFKPQNMANNAAVTIDGGEIGRAQALQARAARVPPSVHMNPVLLKPNTDTARRSSCRASARGMLRASELSRQKAARCQRCWKLSYLAASDDVVLVEGAGSPAEINLRDGDIANMGFAEAATCR